MAYGIPVQHLGIDLRMTENRRLAIAAPAIRERMMTLRRALVLVEVSEPNGFWGCTAAGIVGGHTVMKLELDGGSRKPSPEVARPEDSLELLAKCRGKMWGLPIALPLCLSSAGG